MNLNNIDILEAEKYGGKIIYEDKVLGTVAINEDLIMTDFKTLSPLINILNDFKITPKTLCIKEESLFKEIDIAFNIKRTLTCSQWVYIKNTAPQFDSKNIKNLDISYLDIILKHYKTVQDKEYLAERLSSNNIFGIFEKNLLAGFIGIHNEGSIGMLEVFDDFRRKGYAYSLEAFVINKQLKKGRIPYCHVVEGNVPSFNLQKKLNFTKTDKPSIWINLE